MCDFVHDFTEEVIFCPAEHLLRRRVGVFDESQIVNRVDTLGHAVRETADKVLGLGQNLVLLLLSGELLAMKSVVMNYEILRVF